MDLALVKEGRFAKVGDFSAGLGAGSDVGLAAGKLKPLKASVNPPRFDDGNGGGGGDSAVGDANSPNEDERSRCAGAGGGFE